MVRTCITCTYLLMKPCIIAAIIQGSMTCCSPCSNDTAGANFNVRSGGMQLGGGVSSAV